MRLTIYWPTLVSDFVEKQFTGSIVLILSICIKLIVCFNSARSNHDNKIAYLIICALLIFEACIRQE